MNQRSLSKRFGYWATRVLARLAGVIALRIRVRGRQHVPPEGGVLVCSNHQSYLDPLLVGLAVDRRMNFLARKSLFASPLLRAFLNFYDSIPIDREGFSLDGIKETLRRLKRGEMVLVFPEGTRTATGELSPLKPGFCAMARRGRVWLMPVAIDGAYDAWPRRQWLPGLATVSVVIGEPITAEQVAALTDEQLIAELQRRMQASFEQARRQRGR